MGFPVLRGFSVPWWRWPLGYLEVEELEELVRAALRGRANMQAIMRDINELMNKLDENKDGKVTW